MAKTTRGRQKIEMVRMGNGSNLQVTFSKRRAGLFKKASEIATLCGVDIALVVFSPGEKPFSFGNPSVDVIVDRYLDGHVPIDCPGPAGGFLEEQRGRNVRLLNNELAQVLQQLEDTRRVSHEVRRLLQANQSQNWWEKPIGELADPTQLDHLRVALLEIRKDVTRQAEKIMIDMARAIPQQQQCSYGECSSARSVYLYDDKTIATTGASGSMNPPPLPQPLPAMLSSPSHNFGCDYDGFY